MALVEPAAGGLRGRPRRRFGAGSLNSGGAVGGGAGAIVGDEVGVTNWLKEGDSSAGDWRGAARFGAVWDGPLGTSRASCGVLGADGDAGDGGTRGRRFAAGGVASKGRGARSCGGARGD